MIVELPEWLNESEDYKPRRAYNNFVAKNLSALFSILNDFNRNGKIENEYIDAPVKLFCVLCVIVLIAMTHSMNFIYIVLTGTILCLCVLRGDKITRILKRTLLVCGLSAIALLPAFLFISGNVLITFIKIIIDFLIVNIMIETTKFNSFTSVLGIVKVSSLIILIFDMTLNFIHALCESAKNMFLVLRMRTIGKQNESASFSSVIGMTFVKAKILSDDIYQSMICRCFNGTYHKSFKFKHIFADIMCVAITAIIVFLYFRIRG